MDKGRLVESGSPAALIANNHVFADIVMKANIDVNDVELHSSELEQL